MGQHFFFEPIHKGFPVGMPQTFLQREIGKDKRLRNTTGNPSEKERICVQSLNNSTKEVLASREELT